MVIFCSLSLCQSMTLQPTHKYVGISINDLIINHYPSIQSPSFLGLQPWLICDLQTNANMLQCQAVWSYRVHIHMHTIGLKMCFCHLWWQIGKDVVAAFEEAIGRKGDHIRVAALVWFLPLLNSQACLRHLHLGRFMEWPSGSLSACKLPCH